jgi:hypothetical protein
MFSKDTYIRRRAELKKIVGEGVIVLFGNNGRIDQLLFQPQTNTQSDSLSCNCGDEQQSKLVVSKCKPKYG